MPDTSDIGVVARFAPDGTVLDATPRGAVLCGGFPGSVVTGRAHGGEDGPAGLRATIADGLHSARPGVLAVLGDAHPTFVELVRPGLQAAYRLVERNAGPWAGFDPLGALRRGALHDLSHLRRSPLVRVTGRVALARRAADRGESEELEGQLRGMSDDLSEMLDAADAEVDAVADVHRPIEGPSLDAGDFLAAVRDRAAGAVVREVTGAVPPPRPVAHSARMLVVVPAPRRCIVGAVARLAAHLRACWPPDVEVDVVLPGVACRLAELVAGTSHVRRAPGAGRAGTSAGNADSAWNVDSAGNADPAGSAPDFERALARTWPRSAAGSFRVLADVTTLTRAGVRVVLLEPGDPSTTLHVLDGVATAERIGPSAVAVLSHELVAVHRSV